LSKFKKVGGDVWVHIDLARLRFLKKPPEWMASYLVKAYEDGYSDGKRHVQDSIREAFDFIIPDDIN
jgi:hypothetical protein